jgi:hypothetical protein
MTFDRKSILIDFSELRPPLLEHGLIEEFGVYVNRLPTDLWRGFVREWIEGVPREFRGAAWHLLYDVGRDAAYHVGGNLMSSEPWATLVRPRLRRRPDDIVHGLLAVFSAWGWGRMEAVEVHAERMVVRAYDHFEADAALEGWRDQGTAPFTCGAATACFDLAFGGPYPQGLHRSVGQQVRGIECGDDYGEFLVTRVA